MKTPLMKTSGNLTREESIITVAGVSEGGDDRRAPREEKQKEEIRVPSNIRGKLSIGAPIIMLTAMGIADTSRAKITEANTSPRIMVVTVMGAETSRSSVLMRVSHGATTGTTDVEVKNNAIPNIPGMKKPRGSSRPIEKARNRKKGSRRPNIITGPLK